MFNQLQHIARYEQKNGASLLGEIRHGIEKEGLRTTFEGKLSSEEHPSVLGATLTHPYITTDYSEALLEFITPVFYSVNDALSFMEELHAFSARHMNDEYLWCSSMPCHLEGENSIPVARYGVSNIGKMKQVYREGLAHRYGKAMQTIAGIHYNFSLPESFWAGEDSHESLSSRVSEGYFGLIRNFNRYSWVLMYLFGASPAMDRSFFPKNRHNLEVFSEDTLYLPWATSLRMSDIGYNNHVQSALNICYNNLDEYIHSLDKAIKTPYPPYERLGVKQGDTYIQLNTNILQIENEYYSSIRPKRIAHLGEKPLQALENHGVEYIEVRCLDIDPALPLGLDENVGFFMDTFLVFCSMHESPPIPEEECKTLSSNFTKTVQEGRKPGLHLDIYKQGSVKQVLLTEQIRYLLESMYPVARMLDETCDGTPHVKSLELQLAKAGDTTLTPSARLLEFIGQHGSFSGAISELSKNHHEQFVSTPFSPEREKYFLQLGEQSIRSREKIEAEDRITFDQYLKNYFSS